MTAQRNDSTVCFTELNVQFALKSCQATFVTLGSPDWTERLNAYTVHVVPARIMHFLNGETNSFCLCTMQRIVDFILFLLFYYCINILLYLENTSLCHCCKKNKNKYCDLFIVILRLQQIHTYQYITLCLCILCRYILRK